MSFNKTFNDIIDENASGLLTSHKTWKRVKLSRVSTVLNGYAFNSNFFTVGTGIPLVRIRDIVKGYSETYYNGEYSEDYLINDGDILIGMDGDFNIGVWQGGVALLNQRVCKLTINEKYYNKYFFLKVLQGYLNAINTYTSSVTVKHLSTQTIKNIPLPLPTLLEQKKIAEILYESYKNIDNLKETINKLPHITKALRISLIKNAIEGTLIKSSNNVLVKNEWKIEKLENLGTLERGKSKHRPRNDPKLYGGKYPFIQTGDVSNSNQEITKYSNTYNDFGLQQSKLFPKGTLCITIAANIANTGILTFPACFPDSIVGFIPNKEKIDVYFAKYFIDYLKDDLHAQAPSTAQKNINLKILRDLEINLPPISLQTQIVKKVRSTFELSNLLEEKYNEVVNQVVNLEHNILIKAFSGGLTINWRKDNKGLISGKKSPEYFLNSIPEEDLAVIKKNGRVTKQIVKKNIMRDSTDMSILKVLRTKGDSISAQDLFLEAGYKTDAIPVDIEKFFLEVRDLLKSGQINKTRIGEQDFFSINKM